MRGFKPKKDITHGVDEVKFKNHLSEFQRFYANHKSFCDEVTGIRPRSIVENGITKEFFIDKDNFIFAIRKLNAFVIDNLHYIKSIADSRKIQKDLDELENGFINDKVYQSLANRKRSATDEIILTKKYLEYIIVIFDIGNR
jgi:hypothetical protein